MNTSGPGTWWWRLSRPLAGDEHRAEFWVRHVRVGVALSEVTCAAVIGYAIAESRPRALAVTVLSATVMLLVPLLLAVPMRRWCYDARGALVFYAWSAGTTAAIAAVAVVDGGATSPVLWLMMLSLANAALAYPPLGVVLVGTLKTIASLGVALATPDLSGTTLAPVLALSVLTVTAAWSSLDQWDLADQQQLLAQRLATLADTDELTGCLNRRALHGRLRVVLEGATEQSPVSLCVLDLDGFKRVNDERGHAAGDRLLIAVAATLRSAARETDGVARLGGDEFAVLLPGTSAECAAAAGQRLLDRINAAAAADGVSASLGTATTTVPVPPDALLAAADHLMYEAKTRGGNQTRAAVPAGLRQL